MLTLRELEVLDVVGEVMQERLAEVRREYEGKLSELQTKVAALEARPARVLEVPAAIDLAPLEAKLAEIDERVALLPLPIAEEIHTLRQSLTEKVAALEARPMPKWPTAEEIILAVDNEWADRFAALPPPVDLTRLTEKIAALEARAPEVTLETLRKMGDDLEEVIERRFAMLPPPPDLTPLTVKVAELEARPQHDLTPLTQKVDGFAESLTGVVDAIAASVDSRFATLPPPADLTPLAEKISALEKETEESHDLLVDAIDIAAAKVEERFASLPPPPNLEPFTLKIAALEERPSVEEVLKLTQSAVRSGQADIIERLEKAFNERFAALPAPEKGDKGDKGDKGIDGTSVTVEDFRPTFEAAYARHELETERRIMDLVQRTLDRVPVPKNGIDGKDGFGFDDFTPTFDGERTLTFRFQQGERVKEFPFTLPYPLDKSVWKAGTAYVRGDGVTWGGSWFIAQRDNPGKPEDGPDCGWRLAVKHGRDGKPGTPGLKGDPGTPGKNGRDLNQRLDGGFNP